MKKLYNFHVIEIKHMITIFIVWRNYLMEFKNFKKITLKNLSGVSGGKTRYLGNGLYTDGKRHWVDWSQAWGTIINNSAMNMATGGHAGWNSRAY